MAPPALPPTCARPGLLPGRSASAACSRAAAVRHPPPVTALPRAPRSFASPSRRSCNEWEERPGGRPCGRDDRDATSRTLGSQDAQTVRPVQQKNCAIRNFFSHGDPEVRSEEHTSELQSLMLISYAV